jgi:hypothetical protein
MAVAQSAAPPSLQEQLSAQYKLAKIASATGQWAVIEPGTVLEVKKGGIIGAPPKSVAVCPSKVEGGTLKGPGGMCTAMLGGRNSRYLTVGEKVYPVRLDVSLGKDKIVFAVFECDSCNGVTEASSYRSEIIFQFAKGFLATASAAQIEEMIGQVFSVSSGETPPTQTETTKTDTQETTDQVDPQTIRIGQTIDEVVSALGKPETIVDLGAKQIYKYKESQSYVCEREDVRRAIGTRMPCLARQSSCVSSRDGLQRKGRRFEPLPLPAM